MAAERLRIETLGGLSIERGGETVDDFASSKAKALLAYLACTGREHPRELLAELLWDDRSQRQAMANLRVVLSSLRKEVGGHVEITRTTATLDDQADVWLDATKFEMAAEDLQDEEASLSSEAVETLQEALDLYEGDFLAGFFLPEAAGFEAWASGERERLHRLALAAWQRLGHRHLARQDYPAAIASSTRLVQLDPLAEAGHRQLMEALARNGQRAEALAQYESCCEILAEELGVEPEVETQALCQAIRSDTLAPREPSDRIENERLAMRHNLPAQPAPFFGRQGELVQLDALLADPHARLITISGVGGAGKTRLAYTAARREVERQPPLFTDGVYATSLADYDSPEQLLPAIADAVDLPAPAEPVEVDHLTDYLQGKATLLVLDNFEHLLDAAGALSELVQGTADLKLLVTSRERLNLREERVFPLGGFAADGDGDDLNQADDDPFLQLFLHSARRVRPEFELMAEDLEHLARLRDMTDGLPLAVELAASWVEVLPLAEIATEIRQDMDFLKTDLRNVPRRQRSMRAVFKTSWRRLDPSPQAAFSHLSLFRGGFTREAAQEVAGATITDLATLSAKSLLQYEAGADRYQIHALLRQFGLGKLQEQPDLEREARRRHAAFYCHFLQQRGKEWYSERAQEALAELQPERGNLRLAWKWAAEQGEVGLMAAALRGLCFYYTSRGHEAEARELLRAASKSLLALSPEEKDEDIARRRLLVHVLAWQVRFRRSTQEGLAALDEAETVLEALQRDEVDVRREEAFFSFWRGAAETDLLTSRSYYERALSLYRAVGDDPGTAMATRALGDVEFHLGNYGEAADLAQRAIDAHKALGDRSGLASALTLLGLIEKHRGRLTAAREAHRQAYALLREMGDRSGAARMAGTLAETHFWSGDFVATEATAREGLQLADEAGIRIPLLLILSAGAACLHLGRYDQAQQFLERALTLAHDRGFRRTWAWALERTAQLSLVSEAYQVAAARLEEAADILKEYGKSIWMLPLTYQALALWQLAQPSRARRVLAEALQENMEPRVPWIVVNALPAAALLLADKGDVEQALELYALGSRYDFVANSRWFEDMVGEEVEEWAAALPRDVVDAAQERGRERDLWQSAAELIAEFGKDTG